jgi:NADPH:quinone reductase-like Zn-dependent oxidoreductase
MRGMGSRNWRRRFLCGARRPGHQSPARELGSAASRKMDLRRGEWVLQNAANSAVGKLLIRFARARGLRTVNIVRREASFAELKALGADPQQDSLETAQENILYQSQPQQYALHTYGMEMLHKIIFLTARPSLPASKIADISACVILPYSKASIN